MSTYLGPLGALQQVRSFGPGFDRSLSRPTVRRDLLGGGRFVQQVGSAKRSWSARMDKLTAVEQSVLEQLWLGAYGAQPFYLLDPAGQRNMLSQAVSSGGDLASGAAALTVTGSSTVASGITPPVAFDRGAIRWTVPAGAAQAATLTDTGMYPVAQGESYTLSYSALRATSADTPQIGVQLLWVDAAGATIGAAAESAWTPSTSVWTRRSRTASPPAGAVAVRPYWKTESTTTASNVYYFDQVQLEQASAVSPWVLGLGVPLVAMLAPQAQVPVQGQYDTSVELVEL